MPYETLADLPDAIKDSLPKHAQEIFMAAFNSAYTGTCKDRKDRDACANAIAWSAVKTVYEKKADKWVEIKHKTHDSILQTLNRVIGGFCFKTEVFADSITEWDGIPVIFANQHPDMTLFSNNPQEALKKVDGEIVGAVTNPYIATEGHPRMMGELTNSNQEVAKLIDNGEASISTGFTGTHDGKKTVTEVIPNHVLIFKEDAENMPKDHGAFILNKQEFYGHIFDTEVLNMEDNKELSKEIAIANKKIGDMASKLDIANKAKDDLTATVTEKDGLLEVANKTIIERDTTIEDKAKIIKEFEQKEADALVAKREDQWKTIKAGIPPGFTHKEEDEKALYAEWDSDPHAFSVKMLEFKQKAEKGESGAEFDQKETNEDQKAISELKEATGRV